MRALQPDYAAKIFASYYIENNLVSLSNAKSYWNVGKAINGGDAYASDLNAKANAYQTLFLNNPDKTTTLLTWLNSGTSAMGNVDAQATLNLYVHDGSVDGPVLSGVEVTGQDAAGSSFSQITDENGLVVITGSPGSWQFTATKPGYAANTWLQGITETCAKHAFLLAEETMAGPETGETQAPVEEWSRTFGGADNDSASSVQQTSDGGFILAGVTSSSGAGGKDAWLIKTDSEGNELWQRTFGGAGSDWAHPVQPTRDGGFILAGYTASFGAGSWDAWLIKTDSEGNELWQRTFGGANEDAAISVQPTTDGGYILVGRTNAHHFTISNLEDGDAWIIKTDAEGIDIWSRTFGGTGGDEAISVQPTSDGGYVLAGWTTSSGAGGCDAWLIKLAPA